MFDDLPAPKKKDIHEVGQDLSNLSISDLQDYSEILKEEIRRVEEDITRKQSSASAADSIFKK